VVGVNSRSSLILLIGQPIRLLDRFMYYACRVMHVIKTKASIHRSDIHCPSASASALAFLFARELRDQILTHIVERVAPQDSDLDLSNRTEFRDVELMTWDDARGIFASSTKRNTKKQLISRPYLSTINYAHK